MSADSLLSDIANLSRLRVGIIFQNFIFGIATHGMIIGVVLLQYVCNQFEKSRFNSAYRAIPNQIREYAL